MLEISEFLSSTWIPVASYTDNSLIHTLTEADDGIIPNTIYRFRVRTVNFYGDSDYSTELAVAVAPLPSQPDPPTKLQTTSSTTKINVKWIPPPDIQPIIGYQLFLYEVMTGNKRMIYNGKKNPNLRQYLALDLTPGLPYGFPVVAFNFNGPSVESEIAIFKPCVEPSGLPTPSVYSTT